jgi:hypothetical protein
LTKACYIALLTGSHQHMQGRESSPRAIAVQGGCAKERSITWLSADICKQDLLVSFTCLPNFGYPFRSHLLTLDLTIYKRETPSLTVSMTKLTSTRVSSARRSKLLRSGKVHMENLAPKKGQSRNFSLVSTLYFNLTRCQEIILKISL